MFGQPVPETDAWVQSVPRFASTVAGACAAIVATLGLVVLGGWIADLDALRQVVPGSASMKPLTAVAFTASGIAVWLLRRRDVQRLRHLIARTLAVAVALLGAWVIGEHLWGGTALDLLLFGDLVAVEGLTHDGLPTPHTALAFVACGVAIACLDVGARRGDWPSRVLIPTAAFVSLAALVGHLYGADYLYGVAGSKGMELHTCAAFLVLVVAIAASRPDREPVRTFVSGGMGGRLARQFAPLLLIVPAIATTIRLLGQDAHASPTSLAVATVVLLAAGVALCAYAARSLDRLYSGLCAAAECLRRERDYSAAIIASLEDGLVVTTPGGEVLDVSNSFVELTGFAPEELIGMKSPHPWWPPEHAAQIAAFISDGADGGRASQDLFLQRKGGDLVPVIATRQVTFDAHGDARSYVVTFKDNTDRFIAERSVREAEEQFRTVFDDAPSGMAILTLRHRFVRVNRAFAEMTGYSPEDLQGMTAAGITHPEDRDEDILGLAAMIAGEARSSRRRMRYLSADGRIIWVELQATLVFSADGQSSHIVTQARDITAEAAAIAAREQAETELRTSEQRFRTLSHHAPVGIFETDASGSLTWMNEYWCLLTGLTIAQAAGDGWLSALHRHDRKRVVAAWKHTTSTGADFSLEFRFRRPDESVVWVASRANRLPGADGLTAGWLGTIDDITERREQDRALRESDERFRTALDANADGFMVLQASRDASEAIADFVVEELNEAGAALLGAPRPQTIGRGLIEQFGEQMRGSILWERYCTACETRTTTDDEIELPTADGTLGWFGIRMAPLGDGLVVSSRDITERKRSEIALQQAEALFRTTFESAPGGMVLISIDGLVLSANAAALAIFGSDEASFVGSKPADVTHPDDLAPMRDALARLLADHDDRFTIDTRYVHSAGHTVWCRVTATLVRDASGQPSYFVGQFDDVTDRRDADARVQWLADHDPLTGILNRRRLEEELEQHIALTDRYGARGALLMLDIDHFKDINDTLGHQRGDELIKRVAAVLCERLRDSDVIARLGGDEFAVLLPEGGEAEARIVAEAVCRAIAEGAIIDDCENPIRITTSIGVTLFGGAGDTTADGLLVNADLAMYGAKAAGRNGVCVYEPEEHLKERSGTRMSRAQRIRNALACDGFELWLQPILDLHTNQVTQHEVLLRMREPSGELVPPAAFLQVAERFDLIQEIDRHVATRAIRLVAQRQRAGQGILLEVNLSGKSIGDPALLATIEQELAETGADASRLVFEITETAAVANVQQARDFADRLRMLGCRFALDDFGAGFGSFYYLKHLPFDYLKIDGEFVRNAVTNRTDQLVIRAVVDIARGLGKRTVGEFVEDDATLELLRESGIDLAQGYRIGRPQPIAEALGDVAALRAA